MRQASNPEHAKKGSNERCEEIRYSRDRQRLHSAAILFSLMHSMLCANQKLEGLGTGCYLVKSALPFPEVSSQYRPGVKVVLFSH